MPPTIKNGLGSRGDRLGQRGIRRIVGQVLAPTVTSRPGSAGRPARRPRRCLVCDGLQSAESRYLETLLALVDAPRFEDAWVQGDGL